MYLRVGKLGIKLWVGHTGPAELFGERGVNAIPILARWGFLILSTRSRYTPTNFVGYRSAESSLSQHLQTGAPVLSPIGVLHLAVKLRQSS